MGIRSRTRDGADGQRTLRILVVAPISLLLLTVVVFSVLAGRFNESLSAYYGGPARDVFVGSMVATSLVLLVYRGTSDLEDLALNGAGFFAPFVAFVPYDFARSATSVNTDSGVGAADSLKVTLTCYLVVALAFAFLDFLKGTWVVGRLWRGTLWTRLLVWAALAGLAGHLVLVGARLLEPGTRFAGVHLTAAVLMVASLAIAVASHLIPDRHQWRLGAQGDSPGGGVRAFYWVLFAGMAVGGPVLWGALGLAGVSSAVFWVETWEICLFLVFWVSELRRFWSAPEHGRHELPAPTV